VGSERGNVQDLGTFVKSLRGKRSLPCGFRDTLRFLVENLYWDVSIEPGSWILKPGPKRPTIFSSFPHYLDRRMNLWPGLQPLVQQESRHQCLTLMVHCENSALISGSRDPLSSRIPAYTSAFGDR
jgi:hypothetical protein